ncbi:MULTISPECIES: hypothetical protein [Cylindrospermopsis]|uniref:Glucose-inhibited division protein A n=1 Tax=Cylindrospermopsis curvispora GIHE-G1 TaxID=2666332 RepID=A0A7H0F5M1_9CYAN|nr:MULTISPECIES: hypothetical protein [Cylindrospermopsis]QNP31337.1 hypothetical protein IAR63_08365 [Cylindrospermopsis curvispora GIHE-G1]
MSRSKIIAIVTGAVSILLAIAYLIVVQILDYRDMKPAPISQLIMPITSEMKILLAQSQVKINVYHLINQCIGL